MSMRAFLLVIVILLIVGAAAAFFILTQMNNGGGLADLLPGSNGGNQPRCGSVSSLRNIRTSPVAAFAPRLQEVIKPQLRLFRTTFRRLYNLVQRFRPARVSSPEASSCTRAVAAR